MALCLGITMSCSKEDDTMTSGSGDLVESNGIAATELESYQGDIGVLIQTQSLIQKGYQAATVSVDIEASSGNYNTTLTVDEFTHIAPYKLVLDELSEASKNELMDGVPMSLSVRDQNGLTVFEQDLSVVSFSQSGTEITLNTTHLEYQNSSPEFRAAMPHFIQTVDAGGNYSNLVVEKSASSGSSSTILAEAPSSFDDAIENHQYYIVPFLQEAGVYVIYNRQTSRYIATADSNSVLTQNGSLNFPAGMDGSLHPRYKFRIKREPNGFFTIRRYDNNNPYKRFDAGSGTVWISNGSGSSIQYFNFIALNIDWEITQLDTKHLQPILPAVDTSFGFNSTLVNCGSGTLTQEVGIEQNITTSQTVGWNSSISVATRNTFGAEVTVGVSAEASFFGVGASASVEASASYEFSREVTESRGRFGEATSEVSNSYFSSREVVVPSGRASLVYDAYQTYSDVVVPFVKRFRIKANEIDPSQGDAIIGILDGQTIASQFDMMQFNGVIQEIGSDFIEVSVSGYSTLDNIVDTRSEVRDVAANCEG